MEEYESAQSEVLQKVATGAPLSVVLDAIALLVEQRGKGLLCSILLYDPNTQTLHYGSGPSLPDEFTDTLQGLPVGPTVGSCGAAAYKRERVVVDDILVHPNWVAGRQLATKHHLRACWSTPIISPADDLLGTFAIYYRQVRSPTPEEETWIQTATHLAALAIVQARAQDSLRRSESRAQELARLYAASSAINEAIVRVQGLQELYLAACRIAVESGLAKLAWIGRYNESEDRFEAVVRYGADQGYVDAARLSLDGSAGGCAPARTALRTNQPALANDIENDPTFLFKEEALKRGLRSCAAFPLTLNVSTRDVLIIYSHQIGFFQSEAMRVLCALANNIAFAIDSAHAENERLQLLDALQERVKELTALHKAARLLQVERPVDQELLEELIALVPTGWHFPAICKAKIRWGALQAQTPGFERTQWHLEATFGAETPTAGAPGLLEVVYLEKPPAEPVFLPEERALIRSLGDMIAAAFQRAEAVLKLRANENLLRIAGRSARLGGWRLDLAGRHIMGSEEVRSLLDLPSSKPLSFEEAVAFCDAEYRKVLEEKVIDCATKGIPFDLEARIVTAKKRRLWARVVGHPERDAVGHIVGLQGSIQDIDAHKQLEDQFRQAQKMEAVGQLAGGVAHDFNNMLAVIVSYATLATERLGEGDPLRADLHQIIRAAERSAELTQQLLTFGRRQVLKPRVVDLNKILADLEKLLRRTLNDNVSLSLFTASEVGQVCVDPGRIEQVVLNLVVNARDAMPEGGSITIETANVHLDESYANSHHEIAAGSYVMLSVTDTGEGMDSATRARIFEPFFTTKAADKGTGLGLSTVWGIVTQSGGHIGVYSEPGRGSTFKVYFPRADRPVDVDPKAEVARTDVRGTETILLVEDEEQLRSVVRTILARNGYRVLEAQNGGEAFLICERHEGKLDLLLTDVLMPRMSGPELAKRVARLRPEMRVLYMSGYAENAIVQHGVLDSENAFLTKPFTPSQLLERVRVVLDGQ